MLEYIVFGAVIVVVVAYLVIKNKQTKNNDEISLSSINERLGIIEAAQANIENLNKNLTDFKNLFGDKSKRGKLGEEYLEDLVKDCLVEKHFAFQHTLSNGKRVDCLLKFVSTNENIAIDSKFSWENYEKYKQENEDKFLELVETILGEEGIKNLALKTILPPLNASIESMLKQKLPIKGVQR